MIQTLIQPEFFRHLCDTAGVGLLSVDRGLVVQYCNRKAAELFERTADHLIGTKIGELVGEQGGGVIVRLAERAINRSERSEFEFRHYSGDGKTTQFLAVTLSPILDETSVCIGVSACIRDITRRIQIQEQLSQDRKMNALGSMAGNIAHHFNNILGGIVTNVDFAKNSNDSRVLKKALLNTAEALQRATEMLNDLLAFAEADYRDVDLADLTETLIHFIDGLEPQLIHHQIGLDLRLSQIPVVSVPKNQFMTVMKHLANNAIEAMTTGGKLTLELEQDAHQVICRMMDTGKGIAQKDLERVFEPFYSTKLTNTDDSVSRHVGLGLSVALGIVHELGGEISIRSKHQDSTIVEIRLPTTSSRSISPKSDVTNDQYSSFLTIDQLG